MCLPDQIQTNYDPKSTPTNDHKLPLDNTLLKNLGEGYCSNKFLVVTEEKQRQVHVSPWLGV